MKFGCGIIQLGLSAVALGIAGCSDNGSPPSTVAEKGTPKAETVAAETDLHGEWWCGEHGVPEEICAQCDSSLVADFKAKGDWCDEHNRPDSQCFIHHPELKQKFAAQYEAKYGKQPPEPTAGGEEGEQGHDHDGEEHDHEGDTKQS